MTANTRDRNIDSARREDARKGQVDCCEVINVRPHTQPYPANKDYDTVDVQLIDRPRIAGKPLTIKYVKLNSLQRFYGKFQGCTWNPRIGDMVYIYWLAEREALVLGSMTSDEQEPICRSQADDKQQEFVFKLCPWEEPHKNQDGNYDLFPDPKNPVCFKWWPKTRDTIFIFDCPEGHNCANCSSQAPCDKLDDHQSSTYLKFFSDISPTQTDKKWRAKFHHKSGSIMYFDEDGTVNIENKVAEDPRNRIALYPGTTDYQDEHGPIAFEVINLKKMSTVRGYHDGSVRVRSSVDPTGATPKAEMFLDIDGHCWLWNFVTDTYMEFFADGTAKIKATTLTIDGDVDITGSLTHGGDPCC